MTLKATPWSCALRGTASIVAMCGLYRLTSNLHGDIGPEFAAAAVRQRLKRRATGT
jgi:hypothetical protein